MYLELVSDPWTPDLGSVPTLEHNSALSKVNGSYNGEYQHYCNMERNDFNSMQDAPRFFSLNTCGNNFSVATPLVCPLSHEHFVHGLSFRNRGPSHFDWSIYPNITNLPTTLLGSDNSLNGTEQAGDTSLVSIEDRHLCNSICQAGVGTHQDPDNEPRAIDFSAGGGEILFDLNMEKVRPRKLKKKTVEERELYLNVRRRGGACEKHKLAKRKVSPPSSY